MSSNRSLDEPSALESPIDEQYWKDIRGKSKSKTQMRGKGRSTTNRMTNLDALDTCQEEDTGKDKRLIASRQRKIEHLKRKQLRLDEEIKGLNRSCHSLQASLDACDSFGELSGAEVSQISRHSRTSNASNDKRLIARRLRKSEDEKRKKLRMQHKKKDLNDSCQSLDRRRHGKRISKSTTSTKKFLALFQGKKEPNSNDIHTIHQKDLNFSIQSMFDSMSIGSNRSRKSGQSRRSNLSAGSRSRHSKKSTKSLQSLKMSKRSSKSNSLLVPTFREEGLLRRSSNPEYMSAAISTNSARSGPIPVLSAAADMFKQQYIPGDINKPIRFDEVMSCSSSLSFYSDDDDFDSDDYSDEFSDGPKMASVAEAVEHLNSQNKIEQFVSKMKHLL
jgi:hypothetical protein